MKLTGTPPKLTAVTPVKPVLVMVIVSPPASDPVFGLRLVSSRSGGVGEVGTVRGSAWRINGHTHRARPGRRTTAVIWVLELTTKLVAAVALEVDWRWPGEASLQCE